MKGGVYYLRRWGFSVNEGGKYMGLHMQWFRPWCWFFVYAYAFGRRICWILVRKAKKTKCSECGKQIGKDGGPHDGWQLEDNRTVCQACCVKNTKKIYNSVIDLGKRR